MRWVRTLVLSAVVAFACSPQIVDARDQPPLFAPVTDQSPEEAIIYVFRPSHMTSSAGHFEFDVDGSEGIHHLRNGRYFVLRVSPGTHVFRQRPARGVSFHPSLNDLHLEPVTIDAEAGHSYYVAFATSTRGWNPLRSGASSNALYVDASYFFLRLPEDEALPIIARTRLDQPIERE